MKMTPTFVYPIFGVVYTPGQKTTTVTRMWLGKKLR